MAMSDKKTDQIGSLSLQNDLESARKRQRAIGRQLRGIFDTVVAEGVPDEFERLLNRLNDKEGGSRERAGETGRKPIGRGAGQIRVLAARTEDAR